LFGNPESQALVGWVVVAVAPLWLVFYLAWTGRALRMVFRHGFVGPLSLTVVPAVALSVTLLGVVALVPNLLALWLFVGPFIVMCGLIGFYWINAKNPSWSQPRWYRDELSRRSGS
jgi:hypothetical protein